MQFNVKYLNMVWASIVRRSEKSYFHVLEIYEISGLTIVDIEN